jgi:hypothetical protein
MRLFLVAVLSFATLPAVAHADTVFDISGSGNGGSLSGTVSINEATGQVDSGTLDLIDGTTTFDSFNSTPTSFLAHGSAFTYAVFGDPSGDTLFLYFQATDLVGYTGGGLCSASSPCNFSGGTAATNFLSPANPYYIETGTATEVMSSTVAPEPSSILMLGTALLPFASFVRRRVAG